MLAPSMAEKRAAYPSVPLQVAKLTSSNGVAGDEFGFSVAVCGDTVVVGATELNSSTVGAAYVFVKGTDGWRSTTQTAILTASDAAAGALFGSFVACDGNTVVVGAPDATVGTNSNQGEAYIFVRPPGGWTDMTETARLTSAEGTGDDDFGYSVAISGKTVVIGAPQASGQVAFQGKAYVYVQPNNGWQTTSNFNAELTAANARSDAGLGASVSISGKTIVAGAPNGGGSGATYVYIEPATGWTTTSAYAAQLTASDGLSGDAFGYCVSISRSTVVVGAYQTSSAYVFVEPAGGWADMTENAKLTANGAPGDNFGYSLWLTGNTLVVGAANAPSDTAAYVFEKPAGGWATTSHYLEKLNVSGTSIFGFSVGASPSLIVSGSVGNNNLQGATYVFTKN
jgi:FG-GAP repeat